MPGAAPHTLRALLGLGHLLKAVGRYDEAVASYDACIRQRPDLGETYWSLANLKTYRFSDETVAEMERRARGSGLTVQSEVNFLFALGKAYEDRRGVRSRVGLLPGGKLEAACGGLVRPGADRVDERPSCTGVRSGFPAVTPG